MKKYQILALGLALISLGTGYATQCPDPQTTSLKWGEIPLPWLLNPYSQRPQGDDYTQFIRANILVAGYGRGVTCTYRNSAGKYSIWWPVLTKIPARIDYNWIDTLGGFVCTQGIDECQFSVAVSG
jgi:hypothetical protein